MPPEALALALGAAALHALWNLLLAREEDTEAATAIALLTVVIVLILPAALTWRVEAAAVPYVVGSAALELAYFALLAGAYRRHELSLVYPVARGLAPVLVMFMILLIYIFLGCVMDALAMILLTIPIFYPIVMGLDFSGLSMEDKSIWFGILALMVVVYLALVELGNLRKAARVGRVTRESGGDPCLGHVHSRGGVQHARRQTEDVGVLLLPTLLGRGHVRAERGADPRELVGDDAHADRPEQAAQVDDALAPDPVASVAHGVGTEKRRRTQGAAVRASGSTRRPAVFAQADRGRRQEVSGVRDRQRREQP